MDLEGLTLDREVRRLRDEFSQKLSEILYNGFWFSAEREFIMAAVAQSQKCVRGSVHCMFSCLMYSLCYYKCSNKHNIVKLYKGSVTVEGRTSPISLYDARMASMDEEGGFNPSDSEGFIKIQSIRLKAYVAQKALLSETEGGSA